MNLQENVVLKGRKIGMFEAVSSTGLGENFKLRLLTICDAGLLLLQNNGESSSWVLPAAMQKAGNPSLMAIALRAIPHDIINVSEMGETSPRDFLCATDSEDGHRTVFAGIVVPKKAVLRSSRTVYQWVKSPTELMELFGFMNWKSPEAIFIRMAVDAANQAGLISWGTKVH
ncbi:hypothetical protein IPH92_04625 [Candidatus Kaiserbacteria bacterium]|nr:MAG: hypothetical protein IPH92_04625 [Candidatus Kaiserbacteria bacterium]